MKKGREDVVVMPKCWNPASSVHGAKNVRVRGQIGMPGSRLHGTLCFALCICIALPVLDEPTCHGRASFFVISQTAAVIAIALLLSTACRLCIPCT